MDKGGRMPGNDLPRKLAKDLEKSGFGSELAALQILMGTGQKAMNWKISAMSLNATCSRITKGSLAVTA
jgi:hypothetical protein